MIVTSKTNEDLPEPGDKWGKSVVLAAKWMDDWTYVLLLADPGSFPYAVVTFDRELWRTTQSVSYSDILRAASAYTEAS